MKGQLSSVRSFKAKIGRFTAVLAMNEVACREFMQHAIASGDVNKYITRKCSEEGLLVTQIYKSEFYERRNRYYIAQMHEAVEGFCFEFKKEFESLLPKRPWTQLSPEQRRKTGDESILDEMMRVSDCLKLKTTVYYGILEYYRLVRNCVVHGSEDERDLKRLSRKRKSLASRLPGVYARESGKTFSFKAPNDIDRLGFDDVRVFGWAACRLAHAINSELVVDDLDLVNGVFTEPGGTQFRKSFRNLQSIADSERKDLRLKNSVKLRLVDRFGLTHKQADDIIKTATLPLAQR